MSDRRSSSSPGPAEQAPSAPSRHPKEAAARDFALEAARALGDDKCHEIVVMDVRGISQVTDFIVLASGTSDRQIRSSIKNIQELGTQRGFTAFRVDSDDRSTWVLADFVDVIVHVFEPNIRAHYDLEMLWGDAPRLDWGRSARPTSRRGTES